MAEEVKKKKKTKKKVKKNIPTGRCYINSGFGNTMVSFTDPGRKCGLLVFGRSIGF